jgi:hypothetical protein
VPPAHNTHNRHHHHHRCHHHWTLTPLLLLLQMTLECGAAQNIIVLAVIHQPHRPLH